MQLRLRELILLDLIHESGSLRSAAVALNVTQPAITQALRSLEQAFGVSLVERGSRGQRRTRLTAVGLTARNHLRVVAAEIEAARRSMAVADQVQEIRIGSIPFMALDWMPHALQLLKRRVPGLRVHLIEGSAGELWHQFADGQLDVVVDTLLALPSTQDHGNLVTRVVGEYRILPVAPVGHPLHRTGSASLAQLAEHEWVLPAEGAARSIVNEVFREGGVTPPTPAVTALQHVTRLALAQRLNMLTAVSPSALRWQSGPPRMRALKCDFPVWQRNVLLATRKSNLENPAIRELFELEVSLPAFAADHSP